MNKENRKVVCADCCFIAYKFNQLSEVEGQESACCVGALAIETDALKTLLDELHTLFGVEPEKILEMETEVLEVIVWVHCSLTTLEFSLLVPYDQYTDHIFWILRKMDSGCG